MGKDNMIRFDCPYKRQHENCSVTGQERCHRMIASPNDRDEFSAETARLVKACLEQLYPNGPITWYEGPNQSTVNTMWDGNIEYSPGKLRERSEY